MVELERVLEHTSESEVVALLRELVQTQSFGPPRDEAEIGAKVAGWLTRAGLTVETQTVSGARANIIARLHGQGIRPALLLCAHLDTVPAGETRWKHDPFGAQIEGSRIYGRGSADTKGSLAAMMMAAASLRLANVSLEGDLILLATVAEETGCLGARVFERSGELENVGAIVIGEPTSLDLVVAHRGALWLEITLHGRAAHGSMPELGVNAIVPMGLVLDRLSRHNFPHEPHPLLHAPTVNIGTVQGGIQANVVPDSCRATVDIRTVPGQSHAAIVSEVHGLIQAITENMPGLTAEVQALVDVPPLSTSPDVPLITGASQVMLSHLEKEPVIRGAPYFTDGAVLNPIGQTPTLICGPGEETVAHGVDEYVEIGQVRDAVHFYSVLAYRILAGEV